MTTKPPNKNIVVIGLVLLALLVASIVYGRFKGFSKNKIAFNLETASSSVQSGEAVTVEVHISDQNRNDVTAYDIQLDYDMENLQLVSAKPGGFFVSPMILEWNTESARFSASVNPGGYKDSLDRVNPDAPAIVLEFMTKNPNSNASISVKNESLVYIYQKGAAMPKTAQLELTIK